MLLTTVAQIGTAFRDFSGSITTGGTIQSVLPDQTTRTYLLFQNTSASGNLSIQIGVALGVATISNGQVTGVTLSNAGALYTYPPTVKFLGGVVGSVGFPSPGSTPQRSIPFQAGSIASAVATLSGGSIASITVTNPGSGYTYPPYVVLESDPRDPYGGAAPSATSGIVLIPYGSFVAESSACPTGPLLVYGATTGQTFTCKAII